MKANRYLFIVLVTTISQVMIPQEEQQFVDKLSAIANVKYDTSTIIYTDHAIEQMVDRKISAKHIEDVINTGDRKRDLKHPASVTFWEKCPERAIDRPCQLVVVGTPQGKKKLLIITAYFIDRIEKLSKSVTRRQKQEKYLKRKQRKR